jgi:UDP-galactopyranose mutase
MYLIVGCGLSGATIAERIANVMGSEVLIIEQRDHIAGNCYDYIDPETQILVCKYGAHIYRSNKKDIWDYVNRFSEWERWEHKVLSKVDNRFVSVPVNITTINELCGEKIQTPEEMDQWLSINQVKYDTIENSEQVCKSRVGEVLYEKMFRNYTIKQWDKEPRELDASVLANIPLRRSFDTRYFDHKYQALPKHGYTEFVQKMLSHDNISVRLNTSYDDFRRSNDLKKFEGVIFTGPIDEYFKDHGLPRLEYRSLDFKIERFCNMNYFQPNSVVNYPQLDVSFTRIVEYKHFLNQDASGTIIVTETSKAHGDPYYPVPNKENTELYEKYRTKAKNEERNNVYFVGRLANYKYFNMDQTIENALVFFDSLKKQRMLKT